MITKKKKYFVFHLTKLRNFSVSNELQKLQFKLIEMAGDFVCIFFSLILK